MTLPTLADRVRNNQCGGDSAPCSEYRRGYDSMARLHPRGDRDCHCGPGMVEASFCWAVAYEGVGLGRRYLHGEYPPEGREGHQPVTRHGRRRLPGGALDRAARQRGEGPDDRGARSGDREVEVLPRGWWERLQYRILKWRGINLPSIPNPGAVIATDPEVEKAVGTEEARRIARRVYDSWLDDDFLVGPRPGMPDLRAGEGSRP